jgi:hypothetical protein
MSKFSISTLMSLANAPEDEFKEYDALPAGMKTVLKRKMAERAEQRLEAAADSIMEIIGLAERTIIANVEDIRTLRAKAAQRKTHIQEIERAKRYGLATQNFVPLAVKLMLAHPSAEGSTIPDSFEAKK